jgi:membrane protein YdbS with pleckstrin-like domain
MSEKDASDSDDEDDADTPSDAEPSEDGSERAAGDADANGEDPSDGPYNRVVIGDDTSDDEETTHEESTGSDESTDDPSGESSRRRSRRSDRRRTSRSEPATTSSDSDDITSETDDDTTSETDRTSSDRSGGLLDELEDDQETDDQKSITSGSLLSGLAFWRHRSNSTTDQDEPATSHATGTSEDGGDSGDHGADDGGSPSTETEEAESGIDEPDHAGSPGKESGEGDSAIDDADEAGSAGGGLLAGLTEVFGSQSSAEPPNLSTESTGEENQSADVAHDDGSAEEVGATEDPASKPPDDSGIEQSGADDTDSSVEDGGSSNLLGSLFSQGSTADQDGESDTATSTTTDASPDVDAPGTEDGQGVSNPLSGLFDSTTREGTEVTTEASVDRPDGTTESPDASPISGSNSLGTRYGGTVEGGETGNAGTVTAGQVAAEDSDPVDIDESQREELTTTLRKLSRRTLLLWTFESALTATLVGVIASGINYVFLQFAYLLPAGLAAVVFTFGVVHSLFRYRIWRYEIRGDAVYLERGVFTRVRTIVPFVRIQHVDTSRRPLERFTGLGSLVVYTAGSRGADVTIPGLPPTVAADLQQRLKRLAIAAEGEDAV